MAKTIIPEISSLDDQFGVSSRDVDRVLACALGTKADYADLYFEYRYNDSINLEEGIVKTWGWYFENIFSCHGLSAK